MPLYTVILESTEQHVIEINARNENDARARAWHDGTVISTKELSAIPIVVTRSDSAGT